MDHIDQDAPKSDSGATVVLNAQPPQVDGHGDASEFNDEPLADQVARKAEQAKHDARMEALKTAEQLKAEAQRASEAAKRQAMEAAEQAKQTGRQYAQQKKAKAAEELGVLSGAIRKASSKLHAEQHDGIASYVDAAADRLDQVRTAIESKDLPEFIDDVQDFAKRRPELVYGGMFIAGLAAMRFLKASSSRQASTSTQTSGPNAFYDAGSSNSYSAGRGEVDGTSRPPIGYRAQGTLNPQGDPR